MHVLIAVGPAWRPDAAARTAEARALAEGLEARGHPAQVVAAPSRARPSFRSVGAWLGDAHHEREVAWRVRADNPDIVHVLGCGSGTSTRLAWVARSLGSVCTVAVAADELLCHRGDLVHARGGPCHDAVQPGRCAACCRVFTPDRSSLSRVGSALAWAMRCLGDASPFPSDLAFRNRRDLMVAALQDADLVLARDPAARVAARELGVAPERVVVTAGDASALLPLWESLLGRR